MNWIQFSLLASGAWPWITAVVVGGSGWLTYFLEVRKKTKEIEKLDLEIRKLRNEPEVVTERREIYDSIRTVVQVVLAEGVVSHDQITQLTKLRHDAVFRYPHEIVEFLQQLNNAAIQVHVYGEVMRQLRESAESYPEKWRDAVDKNRAGLTEFARLSDQMIEKFKSHISR